MKRAPNSYITIMILNGPILYSMICNAFKSSNLREIIVSDIHIDYLLDKF